MDMTSPYYYNIVLVSYKTSWLGLIAEENITYFIILLLEIYIYFFSEIARFLPIPCFHT